MVHRLAQIRCRQRVIDDVRHAGAARDLRHRRHIGDDATGIGDRFGENRLGLRTDGSLERRNVVWIGPDDVPVEVFERVVELIDRAAVKLLGRDELIARLQQTMKDQNLRGVPGCGRHARGAAFERGDALLEHRRGGIADAGVDVAESLQTEQ